MTIAIPVHRALSTKLVGRSFNVVTRLGYNPWQARVDQSNEHNNGQSALSSSRLSRFHCLTTRTYATSAAKKPAGRPKAHTGRAPAKRTPKAAATKKPGPKTPAGKAKVGRKPVAKKAALKPKAKPVAKKTIKKAPSKTTLEADRRAKERTLRETALLDPPKGLPTNSWRVYFAEAMTGTHSFDKSGEKAKDAAQKFRNITPEEKEHYNHVAHTNKEKNDRAFKQWLAQYTPEQIRQANEARRQLKKIWVEKHPANKQATSKYAPLADDRLVKRPVTSFIEFSKDRRATGDFHRMSIQESSALIGKEWKELGAGEKKKYEDKQQAELNRYNAEYKTVYGVEPGSKRKKAAV